MFKKSALLFLTITLLLPAIEVSANPYRTLIREGEEALARKAAAEAEQNAIRKAEREAIIEAEEASARKAAVEAEQALSRKTAKEIEEASIAASMQNADPIAISLNNKKLASAERTLASSVDDVGEKLKREAAAN